MFKKLFVKAVSVLMTFVMIVEVCTPLCYAAGLDAGEDYPDSVIADGSDVTFDEETAALLNNSNVRTEALEASDETVTGEASERRSEYGKGYRLRDGSDAVFLYPFSVFEKDDTGSWIEIDNRLTEDKDSDGNAVYAAKSLSSMASFLREPKDGQFLKIETGKGRISWGLLGVREGLWLSAREPETEKGYSVLQPKSVGTILTAEEVMPETDLRLQLVGKDTEENVIVKGRTEAERIAEEGLAYRLLLTGYHAEQREDKILIYTETPEEPEYILSASYMEDEEGDGSTALRLVFEGGGESPEGDGEEYIVRIFPDKDWLLAPERVFPVTIDPTIAQRTSTKVLKATTVTSVASYDPQYICGTQHVGKDGAYYGKMRVALQFDLPTQVTEADMVIDAGIVAKQRGYSGASGATVTVNAHRITTTATIGWNFKWATLDGHYENLMLDSQTLSAATKTKWVTWDITKAVKDWYLNGGNHGIALVSENEDGAYKYIGFISPYDTGISSSNYPIISVTYLNQEGLEGYLSYHTAGSGSMGTVSVSDFNGNLVYTFDDLSLSGEYLPLSIQHVYNHSQRTNANTVSTAMHYGLGFRLNVSQKITAITDTTLKNNGYWYTLTDADGTVHYFKLKSGTGGANDSTYEKEFETTTVLTKSSSGFTLDYNSDLVYTFNTSGFLTKIEDKSNNKSMSFTYASSRLTKVTDGAGRAATLTYDSNGYLTKITDPAGRETTYTYTSNRLTKITSPDGKYIQFTYAAGGDSSQMMTAITDIDGSKIELTYYTNAPCRVKSILEKGTSAGEGGKLTWSYGGGETIITDRKGHTETMMFDSSGHTICIKDSAGNAYFGSYNNTDDNKKHALKLSSNLQGSVTNYLKNHGFEGSSVAPWTEFKNSDGAGSFALDTSQKYLGKKALKVISNSTSGYYGVSQTVTVPECKGKQVTLSAKIKLTGLTQASGENTAGILMRAWYKNASGTWTPADLVRQTANCGWKDIVTTFSVPSDASSESLRVRVYFYHASGTAYIDCMQAELGAVVNRYNLLENGHFREAAGSDTAEGWTGTNLISGTDGVISTGHSGCGFKLEGIVFQEKYIKQTVNVSGAAGDSYVFGAWAKADAIKTNNTSAHLSSPQARPFGVIVRFVKSDNTYSDVSANFEAKSSGWQYLSGTAVAPVAYTKIEYILIYTYQKNTAIFDDAQLYREGFGDIMTYDSFGRTSTETDCMGRKTTYTYLADKRPEISKIKYPDGSETVYTYDANTHKLKTVKDANGKTATYTYDSSWNNTKVSMVSGSTTLNSGVKTYGTAGYVTKSVDSLGHETNYTYNANKGLLTKVTEANTAVTNYTYDSNTDLVTKVAKGSSNIQYTYANRRLTGLSHTAGAAVNYGLTYNQFGARTAVKVGTQNLASFTYAANNGNLTKTTYGNGQYTEPVYDSYDRQTGLKIGGTLKFKWHYGADGRIGLEEDLVNNVKWRYLYNKNGELTSASGNNGETITNAYDSSGKVTTRTVTAGGVANTSQYTYNETNKFLTGITYKAGSTQIGQLNLSYDGFERASRTLKVSDSVSLATTYTYKAGTGSNTTTLIPATIKTAGNGWNNQYTYTYDSMGNIATVAYGGKTTRYTYDSLNQLTREDNQAAGKTWVYSYDTGGNITSAKEYAYTTGTLGTVQSTKAYSYGDSNWKDKLTSYAGGNITYDAIGNPLAYRDGMTFTWEAGRQLKTAVKSGVTTTYTYNSSGIRTSKKVGSTTTKYTLAGTQVVKATTGSDYVLYYYDESGAPVAFRTKTGSTYANYYYVKDLQGDIVAIANSSGAKVVEYTYDAWGKVLTTTGSLAGSIGASNPYRYRGYWYDTETGLYYLQSRYYDPQTGRFINADILVSTGQGVLGCNMFAYCNNNPVSGVDTEGTFILSMIAGAIIGGAIAGAISAAVSCVVDAVVFNEELSVGDVVNRVLLGAAEGAVGGALGIEGVGTGVKIGVSAAVGLYEGVKAFVNTEGSTSEKLKQGAMAFGVTSLTMYAGSLVSPDFGKTGTDYMIKTAKASTKIGVAGATSIELYNKSLSNNKESLNPTSKKRIHPPINKRFNNSLIFY